VSLGPPVRRGEPLRPPLGTYYEWAQRLSARQRRLARAATLPDVTRVLDAAAYLVATSEDVGDAQDREKARADATRQLTAALARIDARPETT
jgi:hypothetical protein